MSSQLKEADLAYEADQINKAENLYQVVAFDSKDSTVQDKEASVGKLAAIYVKANKVQDLYELVSKSRDLFSKVSKAKVGKILKDLIDKFSAIPVYGTEVQSLEKKAIDESIEWAITEKKSFLRQSLQLKMASVYYRRKSYPDCLKIINNLLREFKKLDDKSSLIEVQLLESKVYFELRNYAKSKASLTSAKTSANSVYTSSKVQAELDLMSGILHCEDGDYETAFSYFYESFESFNNSNDYESSIKLLKYMILTKIMLDKPDEITQLLNNKSIVNNITKNRKYKSSEFEPMKLISKSYENKSLNEFQQVLIKYNNELSSDLIIKSHFKILYNNLLEQNLLKIIKPYSVVEISYISQQIKLDSKLIESKLSQMILDGVFYGVLDQGNGWLYIYDEPKKDPNYDHGLSLVQEMNTVVDLLYEKASSLN
ncbi:proteasome regulatory particle lid subunit [Saccharomycopsis crataegensis]|uniref:Proteasome regulatory particle lid subunit n=1 Tax=Saccharomycopsis crataegensis TaxID=43959 RepID=A0AAV5QS75_9ASCO|nr:proteasome regulatory particle lid subunit [Saccharomycopsis crataegensis]